MLIAAVAAEAFTSLGSTSLPTSFLKTQAATMKKVPQAPRMAAMIQPLSESLKTKVVAQKPSSTPRPAVVFS